MIHRRNVIAISRSQARSLAELLVLLLISILAGGCGPAPAAQPGATRTADRASEQATASAIIHGAWLTATAIAAAPEPAATPPSATASPPATSARSAPTAVPAFTTTVQPAATEPTTTSTTAPSPTPTAAPSLTPSPAPTQPAPALVTMWVDAGGQGYVGANLRARPRIDSRLLLLIPNGRAVRAEAEPVRGIEGEHWYRVTYGSRRGYVLGSLLSQERPAVGDSPRQEYLPGFFPVYPASDDLDREELARLLPETHTTQHFVLHYRPDSFASENIELFAADLEDAARHVQTLLDATLAEPGDYYLANRFFPPPHPGLRGFNRAGYRMIFQLFDGSGTRLERQYLAAHELTHQVASDSIGPSSSVMLSEGLAMYASQQYLTADGSVSLDGFSRAALEEGRLVPITRLSSDSTEYMGRLFRRYPYDEAGSFVQFLIETYGLPRFKRVYTSGDYVDVYGKRLSTLEAEWRRYLRSDRAVGPFAPDSGRYLDTLEAVQAGYLELFELLEAGERVRSRAYWALDAARIAADWADFETADRKLREFRRLLPRVATQAEVVRRCA